MSDTVLHGEQQVINRGSLWYPTQLEDLHTPPKALYVIGNKTLLQTSCALSIIGARRATPYGRTCAQRFATQAASRGVVIVSGGARGCDGVAHRAALDSSGSTIVILGGGCNRPYPSQHIGLFQQVIDAGGAVISEVEWDVAPLPRMFRSRNRLIAAFSRATLIVEAGLPSGTFSTADEALCLGREVLVVPGCITSITAQGVNRLLYQGATPIIDDDTFADVMFSLYGLLKEQRIENSQDFLETYHPLLAAILSQPLSIEELTDISQTTVSISDNSPSLFQVLTEAEKNKIIARYPDGRYGPGEKAFQLSHLYGGS